MNLFNIKYQIKTANENEISAHLKECNNNFSPPLNKRVDVKEYSKKISEKAITFEAWHKKKLIGLVAAYFNDFKNQTGFITNVSVIKNYFGIGVATKLMKMCMTYAKQNNFKKITLEVEKYNNAAINLYQKFSFVYFRKKDDYILMKLSSL